MVILRHIAKVIREEGIQSFFVQAGHRSARKIYNESELIYVERSLQNLTPRYSITDKFTVDELFIEELRGGKYPIPPESIRGVEETLKEGCRVFIETDQGRLVGWMLVGKRYRPVNEGYQYPIVGSEKKELAAFNIEIVPSYRKGKAAGILEERVMLKLKEEGYEKMLGAIDVLNRPSLSLAFHLGFKEVKRVRLQKILFLKRSREIKSSASSPTPLERPWRFPP